MEPFKGSAGHSFRKTLVAVADAGGLDARTVSDALGHTTTAITDKYYRQRKGERPEIAAALDLAIAGELLPKSDAEQEESAEGSSALNSE